MHDQAGVVILVPLCLIGTVHENGHLGDQIQSDGHFIFNGGVFCHVRIGIQGQDTSRQLVHDVVGRGLHNGVHQKSRRQFPPHTQRTGHAFQICPVGEPAEQQQVCDFLKHIAVFPFCIFNEVVNIITAVDELAGDRLAFALAHHVAVYHTDTGNPSNDAGTVCISQAAFHIEAFIIFRSNIGILHQVFT